MTGSNLAAIVIPIVVMFGLGVWIALVFHADSHPRWRQRTVPAPNPAPAARAAGARTGWSLWLGPWSAGPVPVTALAACRGHGWRAPPRW